jgi:hypothetical protein
LFPHAPLPPTLLHLPSPRFYTSPPHASILHSPHALMLAHAQALSKAPMASPCCTTAEKSPLQI